MRSYDHLALPPPSPLPKLSVTALATIAAFKNALCNEYRALFTDKDIALTLHLVDAAIAAELDPVDWLKEYLFDKVLPYGTQRLFFDWYFAPAYIQQKLARKLLIKTKIEHGVEKEGVTQVVFLGGGLDPRGKLIAEQYSSVSVYELDRGKTREVKEAALRSFAGQSTLPANFHLVECDFIKDDVKAILKQNGFDPAKKTLFIAEGLTMYLSEEENIQLLKSIHDELASEGSEILISFRSALANQKPGAALQAASQESYRFAMPPDKVPRFVWEQEFDLTGKMLYADMLAWIKSKTLDRDTQSGRENYYCLQKRTRTITSPQIGPSISISDVPLITDLLPTLTIQPSAPPLPCALL